MCFDDTARSHGGVPGGGKPDSVYDGHLSASRNDWPVLAHGALYPGLGEQRQRPCLRLQQEGVTAFHPALLRARITSLWPYPYGPEGPPPACAEHLALCCLEFPLRPDCARESVLPPGSPKYSRADVAGTRPQQPQADGQQRKAHRGFLGAAA